MKTVWSPVLLVPMREVILIFWCSVNVPVGVSLSAIITCAPFCTAIAYFFTSGMYATPSRPTHVRRPPPKASAGVITFASKRQLTRSVDE